MYSGTQKAKEVYQLTGSLTGAVVFSEGKATYVKLQRYDDRVNIGHQELEVTINFLEEALKRIKESRDGS